MGNRKKWISCSKVIYDYKDLTLDDISVIPRNIGRIAVPCVYLVDECESLMCLPCSSEEVILPSGVKLTGVCPICELDRLEDMEALGLYYGEEGERNLDSQLWAQAYRLAGTDIFMGMCTEAIFEHLHKLDKKRASNE